MESRPISDWRRGTFRSLRAHRARLSVRLVVAAAVIGCGLAGAVAACGASSADPPVLYVSAHGSDGHGCVRAEPCRTIAHAVAVAPVGAVIRIAPGTYHETLVITRRLTLEGEHAPLIDAKGFGRGILISGPRAAGSTVRGLDVRNATYEGILALGTSDVTIANNHVSHNDRGFFEQHYIGECTQDGEPPGVDPADLRAGGCGEAIHLASTSYSRVTGNTATGNTGGIYLTDESGPAAHNVVAHNLVTWNLYDCGITLASHSRRAVATGGRVQPEAGGVYDNTIAGNVSEGNGIELPGAGILVAAAYPGSAAYDNVITSNVVSDNGLPGIALHSHTVRQDLNGNAIRDNVIGRNAIGGQTGGPGDGDGGVHHTVGILIWSAATEITNVQVAGNRISDDYFGIWTEHAPELRIRSNSDLRVPVPLRQRNPRIRSGHAPPPSHA